MFTYVFREPFLELHLGELQKIVDGSEEAEKKNILFREKLLVIGRIVLEITMFRLPGEIIKRKEVEKDEKPLITKEQMQSLVKDVQFVKASHLEKLQKALPH